MGKVGGGGTGRGEKSVRLKKLNSYALKSRELNVRRSGDRKQAVFSVGAESSLTRRGIKHKRNCFPKGKKSLPRPPKGGGKQVQKLPKLSNFTAKGIGSSTGIAGAV